MTEKSGTRSGTAGGTPHQSFVPVERRLERFQELGRISLKYNALRRNEMEERRADRRASFRSTISIRVPLKKEMLAARYALKAAIMKFDPKGRAEAMQYLGMKPSDFGVTARQMGMNPRALGSNPRSIRRGY
jgi:hypothetical protein